MIDHTEFMHQLPDEYLIDVLPIAKRIASAGEFSQYNVLQVKGFTFQSISFIFNGTHRIMVNLLIKLFLTFTFTLFLNQIKKLA